MDTIGKGDIGLNATAAALGRAGLLVAKPFFDQQGADLLAFLHVSAGAKFVRIQCKYRKAESSIEIPESYAIGAFICVLHLVPKEEDDAQTHSLYCFFVDDIKTWTMRDGKYILSLPAYQTAATKFAGSAVSREVLDRVRQVIIDADVANEMGRLDFSNPNNSGLLMLL